MTDEEKQAERYVNGIPIFAEEGEGFSRTQMQQAFLAGLKAGRPKWHDLHKDPNDLPPKNTIVIDENSDKVEYIGYGKWQTYSEYYERDVEVDAPIAWCEHPTFDKE